jgi:hypothetical protein
VKSHRWLLSPLAAVSSGLISIGLHISPEFTALIAPTAGQVTAGLVATERSRESVLADTSNHASRAKSYEDFGGNVACVWHEASLLMSFRPKLQGYLHGLLLLMRTQRRFEEAMVDSAASLSNVLLYGSTETQKAAIELFETLGSKLSAIGTVGPQGSVEVQFVCEKFSLDIGDKAVLWRAAARADLQTAVE